MRRGPPGPQFRAVRGRVAASVLLCGSLLASARSLAAEAADPAAPDDARASEEAAPAAGEAADDTLAQLEAGSGVRVKTICTNCNAASLTVNGMAGDRVRVTFDGVPAPGGLAAVYYLTQFPAEFIGHADVVRGPGTVLTGPAAIGGSIEFHSEPRGKRHSFLDTTLGQEGFRSVRAAASERFGPFGAFAFLQAATQHAVDANGDTFNEIAEFDRVTAHGIFDFHLAEGQILTLSSSSYGEDQIAGPGGYHSASGLYVDEDAFFNRQERGVRWSLDRPSGLELEFTARHSRRGHQQWTPPSPTADYRRTYYVVDEQAHGGFEAGFVAGPTGYVTAGAAFNRQRLAVEALNDGVTPYYIVDGLEHAGVFAQYERGVGSKWDFTVGARMDRFAVFGRSVAFPRFPVPRVEVRETARETLRGMGYGPDRLINTFLLPRAQFHYRPNGKVVLGFAVGKGAIGATPSFEETCCGAAYQRSIELLPERSTSYQGTVEVHPTPDMRLTATLFWTDFSDYQEKVVYQSRSHIPYYTQRNIPEARIRGIDLVHDMRFAGDSWNVGWTYQHADSSDGRGVVLPPRDADPATPRLIARSGKLRYTPRHAASAYLRYQHLRRGTKVSLDASWQGSLQHFRLEQFRDKWEPWEYLESESYFTVKVGFEQRLGRKGWSVHGGVDNVTDYVQADLGQRQRCYDWGPIQGRFIHAGMKFER